MAKRFGRNQKKAMRKQLESLRIECNHKMVNMAAQHSNILRNKTEEIERLTSTVDLTARILGEHFIALPVKYKDVKELLSYYEYHKQQPRSSALYGNTSRLTSFVDLALGYIEVYQAETHIDELSSAMHMRYSSRSGRVGYGLSQDVWCKLSDDQLIKLLQEQIAVDMAKLLVQERRNRK